MAAMRERQREVQLYRGQIPSPANCRLARVRFWAAIARGIKNEDVGVEAGVHPRRISMVPPLSWGESLPSELIHRREPWKNVDHVE
jgi:hypothetical protein